MKSVKALLMFLWCYMKIIFPTLATATEAEDKFWCESSTGAMAAIQAQFPAGSLDGTVAEISDFDQALLDKIDVPGLPSGPVSTGAPLTDLQIIVTAIDPTPPLTLGSAVSRAIAKITNSGPQTSIPAAITAEITKLGVGDLTSYPAGTNTSTDTIDGDIDILIAGIDPAGGSIGVSTNNVYNALGGNAADTDLMQRITFIRTNQLGGAGASAFDQLGDPATAGTLLGRMQAAIAGGIAYAASANVITTVDSFLTEIGY
ncbi:MAG: hypothetical protein FJX71_06175 [Alphaproteobacteria bacterium]|nr:hypothetical protein [Alphaproteobacteria bacterium]